MPILLRYKSASSSLSVFNGSYASYGRTLRKKETHPQTEAQIQTQGPGEAETSRRAEAQTEKLLPGQTPGRFAAARKPAPKPAGKKRLPEQKLGDTPARPGRCPPPRRRNRPAPSAAR